VTATAAKPSLFRAQIFEKTANSTARPANHKLEGVNASIRRLLPISCKQSRLTRRRNGYKLLPGAMLRALRAAFVPTAGLLFPVD